MSNIITWVLANWQNTLTAVLALLTSLIGVALIIPGDQPEKFLQGIVDFLTKFSSKPTDKS